MFPHHPFDDAVRDGAEVVGRQRINPPTLTHLGQSPITVLVDICFRADSRHLDGLASSSAMGQ